MAFVPLASVSYVDNSTSTAMGYTDTSASATLSAANAHADSIVADKVTEILTPLVPPTPGQVSNKGLSLFDDDSLAYLNFREQTYVDSSASNAFVEAKAYSNQQAASAETAANGYTDSKFAIAQTNIQTQAVATLASAKSYADIGDTNTLRSANAYTDEQIATIEQIGFTFDSFLQYVDLMDAN